MKYEDIKDYAERCEEHPGHEGIVSHQMVMERLLDEIEELRDYIEAKNDYATQADTEELLSVGELPEPLRLAEMLEKTAQSPLHLKVVDCLRQMYLKEKNT
jgi:hypothetical protein